MDRAAFASLTSTADGRRALAAAQNALAGSDDPLELTNRLRRSFPADLTAAALTQAMPRRRVVAKFGPAAERMYFTAADLEHATRSAVAECHDQEAGLGTRPDQLRRRLKLAGTESIVVILTRIDGRPVAILADPASPG